ncbi:MAG: GYF domain-containing protein, partial [Polyangiaceae bacterium]
MRFLCEQCKAKYQISDDKIAGKTVRMKCRKCGHMIEVRADVTETSVQSSLPVEAAAGGGGGAPAKPGTLPRPATKPIPPRSKLATNLTSSAPPKTNHPSALAGAFQRTVAGAPATSVRPQNPDDSAALDMLSASANPWYVAINGVPVGPVRLSELRRKAQSGIVTESSLVWQEGVEEWRPVKTFPELAQIVREAAATGRPSLVSSPPAGLGGERVSQIPLSPNAPQAAQRPAAPARPTAPRAPGAPPPRSNVVPIASSRKAPADSFDDDLEFEVDERDKTTVDVGQASTGAAAGLFAAPAPAAGAPAPVRPSVAPDPFAAPPPAANAFASPGLGGTLVLPGAAGSPSQPPGQYVVTPMGASANAMPIANPYAATALAAPISIAPTAPPSRGPNWTVLALLFAAVAFGITAAIVLFTRPPIPVAPVASAAPTTTAAPSASVLTDVPPVTSAEPVDSAVAAAS